VQVRTPGTSTVARRSRWWLVLIVPMAPVLPILDVVANARRLEEPGGIPRVGPKNKAELQGILYMRPEPGPTRERRWAAVVLRGTGEKILPEDSPILFCNAARNRFWVGNIISKKIRDRA
jgi:hypothetical protein